jgi:hypothetical protein
LIFPDQVNDRFIDVHQDDSTLVFYTLLSLYR